MGKYRGVDSDEGWIRRRFEKIERAQREDRAAKRLQASAISAGGVTVKDGGSVSSTYPNGAVAGRFGPYYGSPGDGVGHGVFLDDEDGVNVFGVVRYPDTNAAAMSVGPVDFAAIIGNDVALYRSDFLAYVDVGPGGVTIAGGTNINHTTTGSAANTVIDAVTGLIQRSTSSRKYKKNIKDAKVDPAAVLKMRARTYRDKNGADDSPTHVGFIAEELHDLGLGAFVTYGEDGKPDAISYDRLSVALLAVLKDQERRIAALESADERPAEA